MQNEVANPQTAKAAARMVSTADPLIPGADHGTCTFGLGASRKGSGAADCARVSTFIDRREQDREFPAVSFGRRPFVYHAADRSTHVPACWTGGGGTGGSITRIQVGVGPAMLERAQEGADQRNGDNRMG